MRYAQACVDGGRVYAYFVDFCAVTYGDCCTTRIVVQPVLLIRCYDFAWTCRWKYFKYNMADVSRTIGRSLACGWPATLLIVLLWAVLVLNCEVANAAPIGDRRTRQKPVARREGLYLILSCWLIIWKKTLIFRENMLCLNFFGNNWAKLRFNLTVKRKLSIHYKYVHPSFEYCLHRFIIGLYWTSG